MSENRIDPTVAGLFLVAFIALVFGFLGIELYQGLSWGLAGVAATLAGFIGILFVVLTVSAIRAGNAFATALFAVVAVALVMVPICFGVSFFAFILVAIFLLVFALIAFLIGTPKLLVIILAFVALLYLFVGLCINDGIVDSIFALLFGIFGILAGAVALYLAVALSTEKFPVF